MVHTKVVSFDMDGTITDLSFVKSVWLEGIPSLYATKNGISFEDAKKHVITEYAKVGRERLEWYDLGYWTKKLGLDVEPEMVLVSFQNRIRIFPEVNEVLEGCQDKGFKLIIVTNARRAFLNLELEKTGIGHYFDHVFSSTSDFGLIKKAVDVYQKVCSICGIYPAEVVHVGDDQCFDFEIPKKLGITAFYLDRTSVASGEWVIHNLRELGEKITPE